MPGTQLNLFTVPSPLVERLGREFFRTLPTGPGVYLMRDSAARLLYVGKARNLRQRLNSYRHTARVPHRIQRLIASVRSIEIELCASEAGALHRESELLLTRRPRFNRAGTWIGPKRFLLLGHDSRHLRLRLVTETPGGARQPQPGGWLFPEAAPGGTDGVTTFGPFNAAAVYVFGALQRSLWCAIHGRSPADLPCRLLKNAPLTSVEFDSVEEPGWRALLEDYLGGRSDRLCEVLRQRLTPDPSPFAAHWWEEELKSMSDFFARHAVPKHAATGAAPD